MGEQGYASSSEKTWNIDDDDNNNDKYISRAVNPSVGNLPEAQSAVHVQLKLSNLHIQLKPSKQRNQRLQETKNNKQTKVGGGRVKGQGPKDLKHWPIAFLLVRQKKWK